MPHIWYLIYIGDLRRSSMELWIGRLHGFPIGILTGPVSVLLLLGELPGIQIQWRCMTTSSWSQYGFTRLWIAYRGHILCITIYLGFILAAGRRLPFLMPSRPERRLSRVWPQCMIVSQRAHCPKQILGQFKAYSTYWICCTHAFYTCDTSDILRKLRVQLERYTLRGPVTMWDSDEWVKKKGKCHKNITPPNVWGR